MNQGKEPKIEEEPGEKVLSDEELLKIVEKNERVIKETKEGSEMSKWIGERFAPHGEFFRSIKEQIERQGITGFIADRILPLLYFPAWPEMRKAREEQKKREALAASVGKIRNLYEAAITGITFNIARDAADYERRAEMAETKKEDEELVSEEEAYLLDELQRAISANKLSRAEACVNRLEAKGNLNEIMRYNSKIGKKYGNWDDDGVYNWLVETFGEKRAHYVIMNYAEHFTQGHSMCKGMIRYDPTIRRFVKRDPKDRALYAAFESGKVQVEGEWRAMSHLSVVDEDYTREKYILRPSEFLKARLNLVTVETCGRGVGRSNDTVCRRINAVYDQCMDYIEKDEFAKYMRMAAEEQALPGPTEAEINTQREISRLFLTNIRRKLAGETPLKSVENMKKLERGELTEEEEGKPKKKRKKPKRKK